MTRWLPKLDDSGRPVYLQIADQITAAIRNGTLRPGDKLPTQRFLADVLGVNLTTVTRAFREAERGGVIGGAVARGTFVLASPAETGLFALRGRSSTGVIDLSTNVPASRLADRDLADTLAALQENSAHLLQYQSEGDWLAYRGAAVQWVALRGVTVDSRHMVLCAGAQHALATALQLCVGNREVAVESLTYPGMKAVARQMDLRLIPLEMDSRGVTPGALTAAARRGSRVAVLSPTLQNPSTATMPLTRRQEIVDIARRHDLILIEEDVYGMLPSTSPVALASLAPERVFYVTGLSKTVAPGLRIGYLAVPEAYGSKAGDLVHSTSWLINPLTAEIARRWITDGTAKRRLAWQRKELQTRNAQVDAILQQSVTPAAPESQHRWLPLGKRLRSQDVVARLLQQGVVVSNEETFAAQRNAPQGIRISVGAAPTQATLRRALEHIAGVLSQR